METEFQQLRNRVEQLERDNRTLKALVSFVKTDKFILSRDVKMTNGRSFVFSTDVGTMFGTAADQKLSLWGATPVVQPSAIADITVTGTDTDGDARTKINEIIATLEAIGAAAA